LNRRQIPAREWIASLPQRMEWQRFRSSLEIATFTVSAHYNEGLPVLQISNLE
jgi:hypothetical protein